MNPILWLSTILSLPIRLLSWFILRVRTRRYDPEKTVCPACGFRGDNGTARKACSVHVVKTSGAERVALCHTCFRCGADYFSAVLIPAEKWLPKSDDSKAAQVERLREVTRRKVL